MKIVQKPYIWNSCSLNNIYTFPYILASCQYSELQGPLGKTAVSREIKRGLGSRRVGVLLWLFENKRTQVTQNWRDLLTHLKTGRTRRVRGAGRAWHKAKSVAPQRSLWYSTRRAMFENSGPTLRVGNSPYWSCCCLRTMNCPLSWHH